MPHLKTTSIHDELKVFKSHECDVDYFHVKDAENWLTFE